MKKRVCFICLANQFLYPYLQKYISIINCDYEIIFWNRYNMNEDNGALKKYSYEYHINENASKLQKLFGYVGFAYYAGNIIKNNNYDEIILTSTSAAMILKAALRKFYKGRYIVDIRDYTYEKNVIFYQLEKKVLKNAAFNVISSEGYKTFLPQGDYVITHNELDVDTSLIRKYRELDKKVKKKLVLTYIGLIRFHEQNKRIIDVFANDDRYEVKFIGEGSLALKDYCQQKKADNIVLIDRFPPEKTFDLLWETDIILNLYGNNTPLLDYALSNKLYYASKLGMPILVCPNTFMEEISLQYGFGFCYKLEDIQYKDKLFEYYYSINWEEFYKGCDNFLSKVKDEEKLFVKSIKRYLNN